MRNNTRLIRFLGWASVLLILAGIGGAFLAARWNSESGGSARSAFRQAPDFQLSDEAGKPHRLSELRGNIVILHFWASWCPPCLGEIPQWVEIANEVKGKPVKLVAVSLDENWQTANKVLPSGRLPSDILSLLDPKTEVSDLYGSYAFPETYLISPKGEIITKWVGPQDWKSPRFLELIDTVLKRS